MSGGPGRSATMVGMTEHNTDALLDLAMRAAWAAGEELLRRYGHVAGLATKSSATDPVSDADRASEALLVGMIRAERPDDAILGEEGASVSGSSGLTWVVDPLDGTVNYLYQLDNFSVSVAAQDVAGSVVGVVYDPTGGRLFSAVRGSGASQDGRRLLVNDPVPVERALLATGFGYAAERRAAQGSMIAHLLPRVRDIRRLGSAALDLCAVAAGTVDGYLEEGVQAWDVAAGGLIAAEAGATVTVATPTGAPTGIFAAGPALHAQLGALVDAWVGSR
jgi:myo-inositol-1(or 4)-monophosphatase